MEPGLRDREYLPGGATPMRGWAAAMEPGLRDREYPRVCRPVPPASDLLQWSPVLETGNTRRLDLGRWEIQRLQWSPVLETGNTGPGMKSKKNTCRLQWSPVLETGNTGAG